MCQIAILHHKLGSSYLENTQFDALFFVGNVNNRQTYWQYFKPRERYRTVLFYLILKYKIRASKIILYLLKKTFLEDSNEFELGTWT